MNVIKLKIEQESMFIDSPRWVELENGKEVVYETRVLMSNTGFKAEERLINLPE